MWSVRIAEPSAAGVIGISIVLRAAAAPNFREKEEAGDVEDAKATEGQSAVMRGAAKSKRDEGG
jgi:hypothetical protein